MSDDIVALNRKIDFLTDQVMSLTKRLKAFDEFKEDVALFANDAFKEVINFLADVDFHFRSDEFVLLMKKVLRNIGNFSRIMDQLQSMTELVEDVSPLAKEIFNDLVEKFQQLEQDGLFRSMESALLAMKRLNENFTPEEIEQMGDNHVRLIKISNRFTSSENLDKLELMAEKLHELNQRERKKVSLFKLLKKARNPEVLQSVDLMLDLAATMAKTKEAKAIEA